MNVLLVFVRGSSTAEYFAKEMGRFANVDIFNFEESPYWGDLRFSLPFYIPKGIPVSVEKVMSKFNKRFDLVVEITTAGQYHLTGYNRIKIPKALWALDVYRFDQRKFMLWVKNDFDYIFTSQNNFVDIFRPKKSYWLTYAAQPEIHKKLDLPKIYDVAFVGSANSKIYPERVRMLNLIASKYNLKIFTDKYEIEMAKVYSQSKIVFNKSCGGEINMRIFESLSSGSFLLTDRLDTGVGLEELFKGGEHLDYYENDSDLLEKIGYYLENGEKREKIALTGHKAALDGHTYERRAWKMLEVVNSDFFKNGRRPVI